MGIAWHAVGREAGRIVEVALRGALRQARPEFLPSPWAMKVSTRVFSETPSALARVDSCACTDFGTRATN